MLKKCKVVMLPTNEKANVPFYKFKNHISSNIDSWYKITEGEGIPQHLYFLSDEEIKEGDWVYDAYINKILKCTEELFKIKHTKQFKKIIATTEILIYNPTNKVLTEFMGNRFIPQPSQSFIEKYIEEYNKGNVITEVLVEYEEKYPFQHELGKKYYTLKINPKDNTITIKKVKDSFTQNDMIKAIEQSYDMGYSDRNRDIGYGSNLPYLKEQNL